MTFIDHSAVDWSKVPVEPDPSLLSVAAQGHIMADIASRLKRIQRAPIPSTMSDSWGGVGA